MKYYISLFQKIKDYYKAQSNNPKEIALICPTLHIYEDSEMKLLLPDVLIDNSLKAEALLKKQDLSYQLNSIPSSDKFWDVNLSNTLFETYSRILNTAQSVQLAEDTGTETEVRDVLYDAKNKPTKEKKAYDKYLNLIDTLLTELEQHAAKYTGLQTEDEKQVWIDKMNLFLLKKEKLAVDHKLLGYKNLIEDALGKINKRDEYDVFLSLLSDARNTLEISKKTGIISLDSYLDLYFIPYDFMSGSNGWTKLTLDKAELDSLYASAKANQNDFPEEIIDFDYNDEHIEGIELEFSIITMHRNWFNQSPLVSKYFTWTDQSVISDGSSIEQQFLLPAYPKKMILIKNLKINIDQSVEKGDVDNLNSFINFGPIIMKNQLFTNASTNTKFIKAIRNKETIRSKNLNYYKSKDRVILQPENTAVNPDPKPTPAIIAHGRIGLPTERLRINLNVRTIEKPKIYNSLFTFPQRFNLIRKVDIIDVNLTLATIEIRIKDLLSNLPVYKSEISVIGTNNSIFKEVETDKDGSISLKLPVGNYGLEVKKDGYSPLKTQLNIINTNTLLKELVLEPQSVTYDSYFLIGMVCEKLPKIPWKG